MKIEQQKLFKISTLCLSICLFIVGGFWIKGIIDRKTTSLFKEEVSGIAYAPAGTVILDYLEKEAGSQIVYDGLTLDELVAKLDRFLSYNLEGTGRIFATRSLELGLDPYMAVAIVLHETGCEWGCSKLLRNCNNVGGMKGKPSCNGGSYRAFDTLEDGINSFLNNLYYNYVAKGLTTPEQINVRYAASTSWASKVKIYMNKIKAG